MKKELIIVVIIIICVIIASVLSQNNTKRQIADINGKLENLKEEVIQKEKTHTEFTSEINNIFDDKLFSIYLEHNELEKVNVYLKTAKGFLEANEIEESVPEIEGCIAILEHIEEKQAFNLKNIF